MTGIEAREVVIKQMAPKREGVTEARLLVRFAELRCTMEIRVTNTLPTPT
jgi:hypothetical protein